VAAADAAVRRHRAERADEREHGGGVAHDGRHVGVDHAHEARLAVGHDELADAAVEQRPGVGDAGDDRRRAPAAQEEGRLVEAARERHPKHVLDHRRAPALQLAVAGRGARRLAQLDEQLRREPVEAGGAPDVRGAARVQRAADRPRALQPEGVERGVEGLQVNGPDLGLPGRHRGTSPPPDGSLPRTSRPGRLGGAGRGERPRATG
jgi:hypothetical protein